MTNYQVSIDPGTNATGVCIWQDGQPIKKGLLTLRPPSDLSFEDKLLWLKNEMVMLFSGIINYNDYIDQIAVEQFEKHFNKPNMIAMMKCSAVRGMLIGLADDYCETVIHANKKQMSKVDTAYMAQAWGVKGSKDALDAFHIGIVAGFDRKPGQ